LLWIIKIRSEQLRTDHLGSPIKYVVETWKKIENYKKKRIIGPDREPGAKWFGGKKPALLVLKIRPL
jgi:hypothetical protein